MIATKEQERKALEQIRKIVEGLGDDSYLASAFEGCFKDAEENIDYDMANSYLGRFNMVNEELKNERKKTGELENEVKRLKEENEKLCKGNVSNGDLEYFINALDWEKDKYTKRMEEKAKLIVEFAEAPNTSTFKDIVSEHRTAKVFLESTIAMRERLIAARLARN